MKKFEQVTLKKGVEDKEITENASPELLAGKVRIKTLEKEEIKQVAQVKIPKKASLETHSDEVKQDKEAKLS